MLTKDISAGLHITVTIGVCISQEWVCPNVSTGSWAGIRLGDVWLWYKCKDRVQNSGTRNYWLVTIPNSRGMLMATTYIKKEFPQSQGIKMWCHTFLRLRLRKPVWSLNRSTSMKARFQKKKKRHNKSQWDSGTRGICGITVPVTQDSTLGGKRGSDKCFVWMRWLPVPCK